MNAEKALLVTWVQGGPESRLPWVSAVRQLSERIDELEAVLSPVNMLVAFVIPGSVYQPDFEGVSIGRYTKSDRGLVVEVALPRVEHPEPAKYLCETLVEAIMAAERWLSHRERRPVSLLELRRLTATVCESPDIDGLFVDDDFRPLGDEDDSPRLARLIVGLSGDDITALDRRHRVEALVDEVLKRSGNGHCEGGDIGMGSSTVFAEVRDPVSAAEDVVSVLRRENETDGVVVAIDEDDGPYVVWPVGGSMSFEDV